MARWLLLICIVAACPIAAHASLDEEPEQEGPGSTAGPRSPTLDLRRPLIEPRRPTVGDRRPTIESHRPLVDDRRPNVEPRRPAIDPGVRPSQTPGFPERSSESE